MLGKFFKRHSLIDSQHLYYNEPYIFSVENQVTFNVYHTMDPSKNYTYQLKNRKKNLFNEFRF
jgi:hypothetical protein